jgi:hypothetical protein
LTWAVFNDEHLSILGVIFSAMFINLPKFSLEPAIKIPDEKTNQKNLLPSMLPTAYLAHQI